MDNNSYNFIVPRMRSITETAKLLRQSDPESAISENAIRTLVLKNLIPHTRVGVRYLINFDLFLEYLNSGFELSNPESTAEPTPGIRRIT